MNFENRYWHRFNFAISYIFFDVCLFVKVYFPRKIRINDLESRVRTDDLVVTIRTHDSLQFQFIN